MHSTAAAATKRSVEHDPRITRNDTKAFRAGSCDLVDRFFIVNQQGKVYQKNLGPQTEAIARSMIAYNPDASWTGVDYETALHSID
ncbi:MAG: DUF2950 family protein [Pyrinomonadaceae bacterium]